MEEEKKEDTAQSSPETVADMLASDNWATAKTGFSGMPGVSGAAPAATDLSQAVPKTFEEPKPEKIKLNPHDLRRFKHLISEESFNIEVAKKSIKQRENFCLQLEKKFKIDGWRWDVNQNGEIFFLGKREVRVPEQPPA